MLLYDVNHCLVSSNSSSYTTSLHRSFLIDVPSKIWRPKPENRYVPLDYGDDIDDDLLIFRQYGKSIMHVPTAVASTRTDVHFWDRTRDTPEFEKNIRIGAHAAVDTRSKIETLVQRYWDVFYAAGVSKTVLGFEFAIDTGSSQPVCCRKPSYGPHESKIILDQQAVLLANGWIRKCYGPWGSLVVLAPKPHQESVVNIEDFIWRMCVSYRRLNSVTLPFEYPIPRCEDAIDDFGDSAGKLFFISLDAASGYHQVLVRECDQDKLAWFSPDDEKYTWGVMPFGPRNAPGFYTCLMHILSAEWRALFKSRYPDAKHTGDRVIIDDILLYAVVVQELLAYLECVLEICQKYRLSLKLTKCDFLKERVEYVGHDLTSEGNCPSKSKFDMITDWPLPATGQALHSLIQLCNFYNKYCPWLEIKLKPLRKLIKLYHRKPIPPTAWTPTLRLLFDEVKLGVTSSPCLARYDHHKPTFLKTDWSADGFGSILMQPDDSPASLAATKRLVEEGICDFDLTLGGARLRPCRFDSRKCTEQEEHFHSFVGEAACGRWAISKNKKYLWGTLFYWLCDCSAMKEILDYNGQIHVIRRWAQELLGYHFAVIHRPARMMADVDALSRRYVGLVRQYMIYAATLSTADRLRRPCAYNPSLFPQHTTKCPSTEPDPAFTAASNNAISASASVAAPFVDPFAAMVDRVAFTSCPASLEPLANPVATAITLAPPATIPAIRSFTASVSRADSGLSNQPIADVCSTWLSVDPGVPTLALALPKFNPLSCVLPVILVPDAQALSFARLLVPEPTPIFISSLASLCSQQGASLTASVSLCSSMHQCDALRPLPAAPALSNIAPGLALPPIHGVDFTFPASALAHSAVAALPWLLRILAAIRTLSAVNPLRCCLIIIPCSSIADDTSALDAAVLSHYASDDWVVHCCLINTAAVGDLVSSIRWLAVGHRSLDSTAPSPSQFAPPDDPLGAAYGALVVSSYNCRDQAVLALRADSLCPPATTATAAAPAAPLPCPPAANVQTPPAASVQNPPAANVPRPPAIQLCATPPCSPAAFAHPLAIASIRQSLHDPPCFVYHPDHPMPELLDDAAARVSIFGHSFGLPFTDSLGVLQTRQLSWPELLPAYSPALATLTPPIHPTASVIADLRRCLPPVFCTTLCSESVLPFLQQSRAPTAATSHVARCLTMAANPLPSPSTWISAYESDPATASLLSHLSSGCPWTPSIVSGLHPAFQQFARDDNLCIHHGRLVVRQSLQSGNSLLLIIVPSTLRRLIFDVFHGSPIGGHFGIYKTLFRIRMRFFWPRCRQDVVDWIKECAHCILTDKSIRRHSEVLFSWPVTAPMFVLHCDLWSPGATVADSGASHLLSAMCDLTQFVVSVPVTDTHAHELARLLFQEVLLKVGMCGLIVVDAGSTFCGVFADACALLGLRVHATSRGNHKAVSVERFFRYLNKAVTIACSDRGTNLVWVEASMIATYAWNCSPIDGTDVVRSVPAMGREFKFPFDLALEAASPAVLPLADPGTSVLSYIQQTAAHVDFARQVVALVVADRRQAHRDRVNDGRSAPRFAPGDLVLVRVQVQSDAALHRVAKLSYQVRGPFRILSHSAGSYQVVPMHNPDSSPLSYPGHMLSPVPAGILPCTPVDSPDFRYLNHGHAPLPNPLKRHLNIEQYNEIWFSDPLPPDGPRYPARTTQPTVLLDSLVSSPFPSLASMDSLPAIDSQPTPSPAPALPPAALVAALASSTDKLFFISYLPVGTARPRWYLVRVDLALTASDPACAASATSGIYHVHFLLQHPSDTSMGHPMSRWWPQWNRFSLGPLDGVMEFGSITLFPPATTPDASKFVAWSTSVPLSDPACHLLGPFDFQPRLLASDRRSIVAAHQWDLLFSICQARGIMPPALSPATQSRWLRRSSHARKRTRFA
jgi:hypothetical protein